MTEPPNEERYSEEQVYDSIEDIPLPEEEVIPPISFEGLPDYNLVKIFIDYIASVSDTYPEFAFQNCIAMLSALARRRLYFKLNGKLQFTNIWTLCLGTSSYARKGVSLDKAKELLEKAVGDTFLAPDTTPEGLLIAMADEIERKSKCQGGEPNIEYPQEGNKIRKGECALWKDEAGQFYAQANKPHMQSMKEMLCHFYDSPEKYDKNLVSMKIRIGEIYFPMNFATTPESFYENISMHDVHTGFLPRHNIAAPTYIKKRHDITEDSDENKKFEESFVEVLKLLNSLLPTAPIQIRAGGAVLKILNEWAAIREEYFAKQKNEAMSSFFGRAQINVLKFAALVELANLPYYLLEAIPEIVGNEKTQSIDRDSQKNIVSGEKADQNEQDLYKNMEIIRTLKKPLI